MLQQQDIDELKRIAVNTYENDKAAQIYRIVNGINALQGLVESLRAENHNLKQQLSK